MGAPTVLVQGGTEVSLDSRRSVTEDKCQQCITKSKSRLNRNDLGFNLPLCLTLASLYLQTQLSPTLFYPFYLEARIIGKGIVYPAPYYLKLAR